MSTFNNKTGFYIPHVFPNYTSEDIAEVFEAKIGKVSQVDLVEKQGKDGNYYNAAYVHMELCYETIFAQNFIARVLDPNVEARLTYDNQWYWIVLKNNGNKYVPGNRKPRINLDDNADNLDKCAKYEIQNKPTSYSYAVIASKKVVAEQVTEQKKYEEQMGEEEEQMLNEMAECEDDMAELDANLVSIDCNYIETIEKENNELYVHIYQLNLRIQELMTAHYNEQIKAQALAQAIVSSQNM